MLQTTIDGKNNDTIDKRPFQELVGKLIWLSNTVRPDIAFAVGQCARHMTAPNTKAMDQALRITQYLNQTAKRTLHLGGHHTNANAITTYTDSNWASDILTERRSTSGSAIMLFNSLVSWKSRVQKCIALSATEAEFIAASEATRETLFFKYLLRALGIDHGTPTLLCDNQACIRVSHDPVQHWKLKHIDTRYHFVRDTVREGKINIAYINTRNNVADIFTKPVSRQILTHAIKTLGITEQSLGGTVEDTTTAKETISAE